MAGTLGLRAAFNDAGTNDDAHAGGGLRLGHVLRLPTSATSPATGSCNFPTIGSITIRIKVADDDGGYHVLSHTMTVKYDFAGFYAPVDRPNTMNVSKAGQAIPLKWTLTERERGAGDGSGDGDGKGGGDDVRRWGRPTTRWRSTPAAPRGSRTSARATTSSTGRRPRRYAGSCKSIELVFAAGGVSYTEGPHAFFSFKK